MNLNQEIVVRTAIYTRVSTEDQVSGYGLEVQRERCKAQIIAKGWQFIAEYTDEGVSGTKDETQRPGLAALLEAMDNGEIDTVVILALDRLGRRTKVVLDLVDRFVARGIDLVSCKESLDTSTPQGKFVLTMFAALAQLERDMIVERTTAGRNTRGTIDGERGGRLPLGYMREAEVVISVDPEWSPVVRYIFELHKQGKTLRHIAQKLSSTRPLRGGKQWYASTVKSVLSNESVYRGGFRGESSVQWPRILE
jgi:site-specific DNA recombinase